MHYLLNASDAAPSAVVPSAVVMLSEHMDSSVSLSLPLIPLSFQ